MRLFFATDVHGSDRCFTKFVNAGAAYKVDLLLLGGDITGKALVPFVAENGGYRVRFLGQERVVPADEADQVEKRVADTGYYAYRCDRDEAEYLREDPERITPIFLRLMLERVARWGRLAQERLAPLGIRCLINAGNDDPIEVDQVLEANDYVEFLEGRVVTLPDGTELASCGYANRTPWDCPRDTSEEDLKERLRRVVGELRDPSHAIVNFHCPPFNTVIDTGPVLDAEMKLTAGPSGVLTRPVGSTACRETLEEVQPLLGLHGHIHESRGTFKLGRTLCINPGSEYTEGILRGALVELRNGKIRSHQLTAG